MPSDRHVAPHDVSTKLQTYKDNWKLMAEKLVIEDFPAKVLEIDEILQNPKFRLSRVTEIGCDLNIPVPEPLAVVQQQNAKKRKLDTVKEENDVEVEGNSTASRMAENISHSTLLGTRVMAFVNGTVPSNKQIVELVDIVKPVVREAVENVNKVKVWILFMIPKIEDGNNFGVGVQEDTLAEVRTVEAEAASFLDQISRYFLTRGKIVSRVARNPHIEDYRRSICDLDEKEFLNLRLVLMEIRNHYSTLNDIITKNFDKIKKPRSSNVDHFY